MLAGRWSTGCVYAGSEIYISSTMLCSFGILGGYMTRAAWFIQVVFGFKARYRFERAQKERGLREAVVSTMGTIVDSNYQAPEDISGVWSSNPPSHIAFPGFTPVMWFIQYRYLDAVENKYIIASMSVSQDVYYKRSQVGTTVRVMYVGGVQDDIYHSYIDEPWVGYMRFVSGRPE